MKHIGLFEGIGGFSLAARWMGWETIAWCEWNPFGQQVLKHHFPNAKPHGDITKTDFTIYRGQCDILTGGFPCQPYSQAGKRLGKEDDRHLWPEMLRAIREIQPSWVVGENVRGLTNWNGGLVFDEVQADLEAEGYEVLPFLLPACAVNAPHRRDRIWFIAYSDNTRTNNRIGTNGSRAKENEGWEWQLQHKYRTDGSNEITPDTDSNGQQRSDSQHEINTGEAGEYALNDIEQVVITNTDSAPTEHAISAGRNVLTGALQQVAPDTENIRQKPSGAARTGRAGFTNGGSNGLVTNPDSERFTGKEYRDKEPGFDSKHCKGNGWHNFPTESPVRCRNDGVSTELVGITFSKHRNESIKAYGNAIVPAVALQIFKAIEQFNNQLKP